MTSGLNEALCGCLLESLSKHKGLDFIKSGSYPHTLTYFTWWLRGALNQFGEIWDNVLSTDSYRWGERVGLYPKFDQFV